MEPLDSRINKATAAGPDAIGPMLKDPSDKVILALIDNPHITEDQLLVLAKRRDLAGEVLGILAARKFSAEGYKVKLALVNNPKTPRRTALSVVRGLAVRDMAFVTRNKMLPTELRQAAEGMLKEKIPTLPMGIKVTLSRQVSEEVLKEMLKDGTPQLIRACFENPLMRESVLVWALNHDTVPAAVVEFIAGSSRWSAAPNVKYALARNRKTPIGDSIRVVREMKSQDQRTLYNDPAVPANVKVQIEIELEKKGQPLSPPAESGRVIGIPDDL